MLVRITVAHASTLTSSLTVCMSEPSSSLHMLRQKFAGSQVATWAALSLFASNFPLTLALVWLKQVHGNYNYLQIKASIVQELLCRNGSFLHIL